MKVKILKNCAVAGKSLEAGKTVEVDDKAAKELIRMGRAEAPGNKKDD